MFDPRRTVVRQPSPLCASPTLSVLWRTDPHRAVASRPSPCCRAPTLTALWRADPLRTVARRPWPRCGAPTLSVLWRTDPHRAVVCRQACAPTLTALSRRPAGAPTLDALSRFVAFPFFLFTLFATTPDTAHSPVLSLRSLYFSRRVALLYTTLFVIYGRFSNVRLPGYALWFADPLRAVARRPSPRWGALTLAVLGNADPRRAGTRRP